jgi:hypothetical protein
MYHPDVLRNPESCPALVLNADYTPLSYYPLSLWPWQTAVKAMFLDRVDVVSHYEREVRSPTARLQLPSVIALKQYVKPSQHPAFTRFNLFLRDKFICQYCGSPSDLTFDLPLQSEEGRTHTASGAYASVPEPLPPYQLAIAGSWAGLSAQFPPRYVARLALLGY